MTTPTISAANSEVNIHSFDLTYIKKFIAIESVWNELADETAIGMEPVLRHHAARCPWHDDRTPSVDFSKNNKWRCHACSPDPRYESNIDLVMKAKGCDMPGALRWFWAHWKIPRAHAGRPEGSRAPQKPYRVGFGGPLEMMVRSGLFSELSHPAVRLLAVLVSVQDRGRIDWSYAALMAASGIRSSDSLSKGLKELIGIHAIEVRPVARLSGAGHRNLYRLTLDDSRLAAKMEDSFRAHHFANEQARKFAAERRKLRSHA